MKYITKLEAENKELRAEVERLEAGLKRIRDYAQSKKFMSENIEDTMINKNDIILRVEEILCRRW